MKVIQYRDILRYTYIFRS